MRNIKSQRACQECRPDTYFEAILKDKKRGDDLDIIAPTNEGGLDWRVIFL